MSARADTLFELTDAVLCSQGPVTSLAELSLAAEHRRGHGALYDGVNHDRIEVNRLRVALAGLSLPRAADGRLVLAVDVSVATPRRGYQRTAPVLPRLRTRQNQAQLIPWRQAFLRRFDIEHTFRLFKQTQGWARPKIRTPEAADRWSWLIIVAYTQLRLARPLIEDCRKPWERPVPGRKLTPARVRREFRNIRPTTISCPPAHRNPASPAQDDHPARSTAIPHHATSAKPSNASSASKQRGTKQVKQGANGPRREPQDVRRVRESGTLPRRLPDRRPRWPRPVRGAGSGSRRCRR